MKQWMAIVMGVALFSGCSMNWNFWSQKAPEPTKQEAKAADVHFKLQPTVLMYELDIADRPYKNMGEVSASVTKLNPWGDEPKQADVEAKLKEEALKKGADALIFVRYEKLGASWNRLNGIEGKAQAVKFTHY